MNLSQFFSHVHAHSDWHTLHSITYFKGEQSYPLLFFSLLFSHLKKNSATIVQSIDVMQEDIAIIRAKLETTFLGSNSVFWLKNISNLDEKKEIFWLQYMETYTGPNHIIFYSNHHKTLPLKLHQEVLLSDMIDRKTFHTLIAFFYPMVCINKTKMTSIFISRETVSLDTACVLIQYIQLLGSNNELFIEQWLDKIVMPDKSLFTLSSALFAKKPEDFFKLWARISADFADVFWVSFWSEQFWRAYQYVLLTRNKQFAQAKKISMRLPFTFIQRDWKIHTPQSLLTAHQHIYAIDSSLKNGGSAIALDLFYSKFLQK